MESYSFWLQILAFLYFGGSIPRSIDGFTLALPPKLHRHNTHPRQKWTQCSTCLAAKVDVEAASAQLLWEAIEEKESRPVLNLSRRDTGGSSSSSAFSLESLSEPQSNSSNNDTDQNSYNDWKQGNIWIETEKGLQVLGFNIVEDGPTLLKACPQLYRLETAMVLETAAWCIDTGFDIDYLLREPRILSYRCKDVAYGLEFITTMLMLKDHDSLQLGVIVPPLLLSGIDGGLQERAVQKALGDASDATYSANQRMAGDAAATLAQLKQKRNNQL